MKTQKRQQNTSGHTPRSKPIVFTLAVPLLSLAFSGCANMAEVQKSNKEEGASTVATQRVGPIAPIQGATQQKEVLSAIRDMELVSASSIVFNFLKSDVPVEDKYNVVNAFVFKYAESGTSFRFGSGNPALDELAFYAANTFSTDFSMGISDLKEKEPERLSYMQALAYGFAKCGQEGFNAALRMVANMDAARNAFKFPGFSKRDISLAGPFANMVCISMVRSNKLDTKKAISELTQLLRTKKIGAETKSALLNLVKIIDPLSFSELLKDPKMDELTKKQITAAANSTLNSPRVPEQIKKELKTALDAAR